MQRKHNFREVKNRQIYTTMWIIWLLAQMHLEHPAAIRQTHIGFGNPMGTNYKNIENLKDQE
ncbi:hypothetical protein CBL_13925 [Carabus blaptoides fortunei]